MPWDPRFATPETAFTGWADEGDVSTWKAGDVPGVLPGFMFYAFGLPPEDHRATPLDIDPDPDPDPEPDPEPDPDPPGPEPDTPAEITPEWIAQLDVGDAVAWLEAQPGLTVDLLKVLYDGEAGDQARPEVLAAIEAKVELAVAATADDPTT